MMNDKIAVLNLGGQERTLHFGKMGFLKHLGELLKADPLSLFTDGISTDPAKAYHIHKIIIQAGLMCECDLKKQTYDDPNDVDLWVSCLDQSDVQDLVLKAFAAMAGKSLEEIKNVISQAATSNGTTKVQA